MTSLAMPTQPQSAYTRAIGPYVSTSATQAIVTNRAQEGWDRAIRSLRGLIILQDDWDGQGASAPPPQLVRSAIELADILRRAGAPAPSTAVATPAGTILFGWGGASSYYEIEVIAPYQAEWMLVEDGVTTHGEVSPL